METYNTFMEWILGHIGGQLAEYTGILFFIMAGWLIVKRKQIRAGTMCFIISAMIAFGSTIYAYWRHYNG